MLFSSPLFLFLFLPVVLALAGVAYVPYALTGRRGFLRALVNPLLFAASLVFYAWGEPRFVLVMLVSIAGNWALGWCVGSWRGERRGRLALAAAVAFDLGLIGFFKYWNFLWDNLEALQLPLARFPSDPVGLPIGISFFTFQALSYVIDVHRGDAERQRNPLDFGLYIALFPQLIAGPIVRYRDIARQLVERAITLEGFARGVRRFTIGLGKKVLIANVVAGVADEVFGLESGQLTASVAWLGTLAYALQIYFDFSGYSDMAIGLGLMLGFRFRENFEHPYVSRSVTEFWRRWHVSLSTFFRDYLYVPLGGNRGGRSRTLANLAIVFFLCGLWHGAAWSFVVWGLYHGAFLVLERAFFTERRRERGGLLGLAYTWLVVMVGWVFFRADTLARALAHLQAMAGLGHGDLRAYHAGLFLDPLVATAIVAGVVGSAPWMGAIARWRERRAAIRGADPLETVFAFAGAALVLALLYASSLVLAAGTYDPFIYFRF
jgi:alginate O-acetyltransferase complex protein AlgI